MNGALKCKIQEAITKAVEDMAGRDNLTCDGYIYDELYEHMTDAAALVFDSCMAGQKYAERENEDTKIV